MPDSMTERDIDSYSAGEVLPDGRIKLATWSPVHGYAARSGVVFVTKAQAKAAEPFGWRCLDGNCEYVRVERP